MSQPLKNSLDTLVNHFEKHPEKAEFTYEANTSFGDGLSVNVKAQQFEFKVDEPKDIGGQDEASNPIEYVLAALGACHSIVFKALAVKEGLDLDQVNVNLKGNWDSRGFFGIDKTVRNGFQDIEFETEVASTASIDELERIFKRVEDLCPVNDIVSNPTPIVGNLTIQNTKGEIVSL